MEVMKNLTKIFSFLAVAFFICGCSFESFSDNSSRFNEKNKIKIFLITMDKEIPYWEKIDEGCREAVDESDIINYEWLAPFERREDMQNECIDQAVGNGANVIIISPVLSESVNKNLEQVGKAGVKIIYIDNPAEYSGVATLATDDERAGKVAAEIMMKALKEAGITSGTVGVVANTADTTNTALRDKGFRATLRNSDFQVAPTIYANGNPNVVIDSVKAHSDFVGFFATNQTSTLLIGEQMRNSAKNQIVVGFDMSAETVKMIDEGAIYASVRQNAKKMGSEAIKIAVEVMTGKHDRNDMNIDTGVVIVTKNNLSQAEE